MRGINNYKDIPEYTDSVKLPAGAYEVNIIRAEEQEGSNNSCALCLLFDIANGDYAGYFRAKFAGDKKAYPDTAKYKGVLRLWYPNGDSDKDKSNEKRIKTALERIKESNNLSIDFSKEWDGAKLKNCKVGMIFRDCEYDYKGYRGMTAQPYQIITLENLKEGKFTIPNPKYLNGGKAQSDSSSVDIDEITEEDDLPF